MIKYLQRKQISILNSPRGVDMPLKKKTEPNSLELHETI